MLSTTVGIYGTDCTPPCSWWYRLYPHLVVGGILLVIVGGVGCIRAIVQSVKVNFAKNKGSLKRLHAIMLH